MICCDRFFIFLSLATLAPHQPFQNRTIPYLALNSPPLSMVRCRRPKEFGRLPEGLPQLHRPPPSPQPLQKDNSTLLRTKLASLVKGEVPSPEKIRATTGGIATPTFRSALTFPKPHYPSKIANTLASLVKGRWLDGTTQTVALLRPACDMSALFILQTFQPSRRRDCLSCIDPLHPHNHCKKAIVPRSALNLPPLSKARCCRPKEFGRLPEELSHQPFAPHQPFKNRTIPPTFRRARGLPLPLHRSY